MTESYAMALVIVLTIILIFYLRRLRNIQKENLRLEEKLGRTRQFYTEVENQVNHIRRYRHDLKNHIRIVEEFLETGEEYAQYEEYQELLHIMYGMQDDVNRMQSVRYCGNEVLNAICQIRQKECDQEGIPYEVEISYNDISWLDGFHLTGIIMNLLDNAFEAQKRLGPGEKKQIRFLLTEEEDRSVYIAVGNTVASGESMDFKTKKKDVFSHGLGLEIASDYSAIYRGELSRRFSEEDRYLTVWTVLYPPV